MAEWVALGLPIVDMTRHCLITYEKANANHVWDGTPWEAEHALFQPNYDRIVPWLANTGRAIKIERLGTSENGDRIDVLQPSKER